MKLSSSVFNNGDKIPAKYTCQGVNINPPLSIEEVPSSAVSLAIIMDDPDVPKHLRPDGFWDHWVLYNIPSNITDIAEATHGIGFHGLNTSGEDKYMGPCPPDREHRYFFRLFALDILLDTSKPLTKHELLASIEGHVLAEAELMGLYEQF